MLARLCTCVLFVLIGAHLHDAAAQEASRYPLMTIEQHRASIVKAVVDKWADAFAVLPYGEQRSAEQLGNELYLLRSDRLLAASLSGTFVTVLQVLNESKQEAGGKLAKPASAKALGDSADDLTFTPVTPCRLVDTRLAGGQLSAGLTRSFVGFAASSFASQGGAASNCAIPNGVAALAVTATAVQPAAPGFITLWQASVGRPQTSTVNYALGAFATATGAIVPVDSTSSNRFAAWSPADVDLVVDVTGYFSAPRRFSVADVAHTYVKTSANVFVNAGLFGSANAQCNPGDLAIGGSYGVNGANFLVYFAGIKTTPGNIGSATQVASFYEFEVRNNNAADQILIFSDVTCAPVL